MKIWTRAAVAAVLLVPAVGMGQTDNTNNAASTSNADEIVVVGRSISTTSTRIEVGREMIVDTASVLKDVPGANVNSNGRITGIAQYRGMYGDRISVDIDELGTVSGGPNAMDTPLSYMSPMITEELIVERGIASVSKAPESIGGYISTRIARGNFGTANFGFSGSLGSRYAGNGDVSTSAGRLTLANDTHRISVIGETDRANDVTTPAGQISPSGLSRARHDVSYGFAGDGSNLLLFAGRLDTSDAGTPALPMDIRYIDTDLYGIQLSKNVSERFSIEGRFAENDVEHLMDNFSLRDAPMPMRYRQNLARGAGSQYYLSGLIQLDQSELRVGVDGIEADHNSVITNPNMAMFRIDNFTDVSRNVLGVFAEWKRDFDLSGLEFGLRYKRVETNAGSVGATGMPSPMGMNVSMIAGAFNGADRSQQWNSIDAVVKYRYRVSNHAEWQLELGSKTRAPSYQELYLWLPLQATGGLADGRSYVGDLSLAEERSNEVVMGVTSEIGRLRISPQLFYRQIDNYIQGIPSTNLRANMVSMMMTGAAALQFANVHATIYGADVAWKFDLGDKWFVDGVASYSRGKRTDVRDNLYRLAPINGSIGFTYVSDTWTLKPELVIYAKQNRVSMFNGERPAPGYELLNIAFAWDCSAALRFEARVDNLFDEGYQDHLAGINRAMGSDINVGDRLSGVERTISVGVMFNF